VAYWLLTGEFVFTAETPLDLPRDVVGFRRAEEVHAVPMKPKATQFTLGAACYEPTARDITTATG